MYVEFEMIQALAVLGEAQVKLRLAESALEDANDMIANLTGQVARLSAKTEGREDTDEHSADIPPEA